MTRIRLVFLVLSIILSALYVRALFLFPYTHFIGVLPFGLSLTALTILGVLSLPVLLSLWGAWPLSKSYLMRHDGGHAGGETNMPNFVMAILKKIGLVQDEKKRQRDLLLLEPTWPPRELTGL